MREWSHDAQLAMLKWLNDVTDEHPNPTNQIELWRVRKGDRELRCVAVYLLTGIDVRVMEGENFRRTQLVKDSLECEKLSEAWRQALFNRGWTRMPTGQVLMLYSQQQKASNTAMPFVSYTRT